MGLATFIGGIHPFEGKELSEDKPIKYLEPLQGEVMVYPLSQHIGAPAKPLVAKGDHVLKGQIIAEAGGFISANVLSSVSGTVKGIESKLVANGAMVQSILVENDGEEEAIEGFGTDRDASKLSKEEIRQIVKDAGLVGLGGAGFPTHVKLTPKDENAIDYVIVNGAECEPYLTSDYRTMIERPEQIIGGLKVMLQLFDNAKGVIGIENNKPDAIAHLTKIAAGYKGIEVVPLKVMYPQGGEKQLIAAVTGRQVPPPPALPIDVGAVVCNASTTVAVYQAVLKNKPLIERVVTVTGKSVKEPKNLLTRMGTPISALIEAAGGLPGDAGKVINGGPMMGRAMVNLDSPVTKGCSGITVMSGRDAQRREATQCIKCAKCVSACPMGLEPYYLSKMTQKKGWDELEALMITSCIECGCCQSTCPAYLPLLDWVRLGKQTVMGLIRARAAAAPKK